MRSHPPVYLSMKFSISLLMQLAFIRERVNPSDLQSVSLSAGPSVGQYFGTSIHASVCRSPHVFFQIVPAQVIESNMIFDECIMQNYHKLSRTFLLPNVACTVTENKLNTHDFECI